MAPTSRSGFKKTRLWDMRSWEKLSNVIARRLQKRTETLVDAWGEAFGNGRTAQL